MQNLGTANTVEDLDTEALAQPTASGESQALSLKRWIFPVAVFGSSGMNSIQRGYL